MLLCCVVVQHTKERLFGGSERGDWTSGGSSSLSDYLRLGSSPSPSSSYGAGGYFSGLKDSLAYAAGMSEVGQTDTPALVQPISIPTPHGQPDAATFTFASLISHIPLMVSSLPCTGWCP